MKQSPDIEILELIYLMKKHDMWGIEEDLLNLGINLHK